MARDPATDRDRFMEDRSGTETGGSLHFDRELVHQWIERYHLAATEISLEQIARVFALRGRTEESRRELRTGNEHSRQQNAGVIRSQRLALHFADPDDRRLRALP